MKKIISGLAGLALSFGGPAAIAQSYHFVGTIPTFGSTMEGDFSIVKSADIYKLTAFSGHVGSVNYSLSDVALLNGSETKYSYLNGNIIIGGKQYGANGIVDGTDDFWIGWFVPAPSFATWANVASPLIKGEDNVRLTITQTAAAVPEPASWGLMILGFAVAGFALRRTSVQRRQPRLSY